jgi:hypothetical protein
LGSGDSYSLIGCTLLLQLVLVLLRLGFCDRTGIAMPVLTVGTSNRSMQMASHQLLPATAAIAAPVLAVHTFAAGHHFSKPGRKARTVM